MRRRGRSPEDLDAVDVLLVEDEDADAATDEVATVLRELALEAMARRATWSADWPEPPDPAPAAAEPLSRAHRLVRRYRRRAVTGAVLAVAVAATTAVVDARQTAARAAALAATPAVLAEVAGPPVEVWRVPGRVVTDQHDRLLVVDGEVLRALDPASGEAIWTASAEAGRAASAGGCMPVDEDLAPDRAPVERGTGPRDLVACTGAGGGASGRDPTAGVALVVLDSTTGRTRHTLTADGTLLRAEPVGRDLVVATALADGRVRITRWDLGSGTPAWDAVSPQPVLDGGAPAVVERRPDSLTVAAFAVDLGTGEQLDAAVESAAPFPYEEHALPGGARATWTWRKDGTSGQGRVTGGGTGSWFILPGPPLRPSVTDGSDRGVLVTGTAGKDRLRGLDLRGGRMRWTEPVPQAPSLRATALVDGVLLLDGGAAVTALDVRTGDPLWRRPVADGVTHGAALTDGRLVLLPVRADDGAPHLVACRFADGTVDWRAGLPSGTASVRVVDHRLVAMTDDEVVGLG